MMAPKDFALIDEDGKQKSGGARYTPDEMMFELLRIPRKWDHSFKPVLTADKGGGQCCVLQCKHCLAKLSPSNPSGTTLDHLKRCSKYQPDQPRRSPRQHAGSSKGSRSLSDDEDAADDRRHPIHRYTGIRNRLSIEVAEKCIFVKANCGRKELAGDELVAVDSVE